VTPEERHADAVEAAREGCAEQRRRYLYENNRRLLAERGGWPAGALDGVRAVEKACPGWTATWFGDWRIPGFERVAGFYAWRTGRDPLGVRGDRRVRRHEVYGATPDQLAEALGAKLA
jgi:hypothetical protein